MTDAKLEARNNRLKHKMSLRYERALRKAVNMERKLLRRNHERSMYPTMAQQVDFSLNPYQQQKSVNPYQSRQFAVNSYASPYQHQYAAAQVAPPTKQIVQSEPQMFQRQWSNLGRLYTCYTCVGCMMALPCQQQIYSPQNQLPQVMDQS